MSHTRRILRVGKLPRWQRLWIHGLLAAVAFTGCVWFVLIDVLNWPPSRATFWWISHGVVSFLSLVAMGATVSAHIPATWRARRNIGAGIASTAVLAVAAVSALLLLYGPEEWHSATHIVHVAFGLAAFCIFPWHVIRGRTSRAAH